MQSTGITQSLDGHDLFAFGQRREQQTRAYRLAIQKHGACATHADAAALARAEELEFVAQHFEQIVMRVYRFFLFDTINFEFNNLLHVLPRCPALSPKQSSCSSSIDF